MLEHQSRTPLKGAVSLQLKNQPLNTLLGHLLQEWDYQLTDQPQGSDLLIREPAAGGKLNLQACDRRQIASFELPLKLPQLYKTLATQLQSEKPEHQLRLRIELPLAVMWRGEEFISETRIISDRGLRFSLPQELPRGEQLELQLLLGERKYHLTGLVVYALPGKELGWGERVDIGVVFKPLARSTRQYLLNWLLGCYLQRLQALMDPAELQTALQQLSLPQSSLGMLKKLLRRI